MVKFSWGGQGRLVEGVILWKWVGEAWAWVNKSEKQASK